MSHKIQNENFVFNCFTQTQIVNAVNEQLSNLSNARVRATSINVIAHGQNPIILNTECGGVIVAIMYSPNLSCMGFRGIHKIKNKNRSYAYLFNGQASRNLNPLVFNGEGGPLCYATASDVRQYFLHLNPNTDSKYIDERISYEAIVNPSIAKSQNIAA